MKEVTAIIRINKVNQTKEALAAAGISSMTAAPAYGRGQGQVDFRIVEGAREGYEEAIDQLGLGPKLMPKRLITLVVPDSLVRTAVDTLISVNKDGDHGDGKIFVTPVFDAVRVRTGETGAAALSEAA